MIVAPWKASQRPVPPVQLLQPSAEGNKESARSVEHSEKERGNAQRGQHVERGKKLKKRKTLRHTRASRPTD